MVSANFKHNILYLSRRYQFIPKNLGFAKLRKKSFLPFIYAKFLLYQNTLFLEKIKLILFIKNKLPTVDEWEFAAIADRTSKDASEKPEFTDFILKSYQNKKITATQWDKMMQIIMAITTSTE